MANREQVERWLLSEAAGDEDAAEVAFAQLFTALPKASPTAGFVDRTVFAVLRLRSRRRRLVALAWAASLLVAVGGGLLAYVAAPHLGQWTIKTVAFATGRSVPWLIAYTSVALDWWWIVAHVGGRIALAVATPVRASALVGIELIGILAFFALQKIARAEPLGDA